jgi:hypothetical protein
MKRDSAIALLGGLGFGAGLALLLDPASGRRRRALLRDQIARASNSVCGWVDVTRTDLGNRTQGTIASLRSRFNGEPVSDEVLIERVRANLGHVVDRVDRVEVSVQDGHVELRGAVAPHEAPRILARIWSVPGVLDVINRLELRAATDLTGAPPTDVADEAGRGVLQVAGYAALGLIGAGATWLAIANRDAIRDALEEGAVRAARAGKRLRKKVRREHPMVRSARSFIRRVA